MKAFVLHGKSAFEQVQVLPVNGFIRVSMINRDNEVFEAVFVEECHYDKLASYKRLSSLYKYAVKHRVYPDLDDKGILPLPEQPSYEDDTPASSPSITETVDCKGSATSASDPEYHAPAPTTRVRGIFFKDGEPVPDDQLIFCDTETTGMHRSAEVCELSLIDINGNVLLDTLIKPKKPIPKKATRIHGISNEMVRQAPTFDQIWSEFKYIVSNKHIVFYNADFDARMITQSVRFAFEYEKFGMVLMFHQLFSPPAPTAFCLMKWYAKYWGEWSDWFGNYKWQTLVNACFQQDVRFDDVPNHRALGDAIKTLRLYKHLSQVA